MKTPVQIAVAKHFELEVEDLLSASAKCSIDESKLRQTTARHIARYLEHVVFGRSLMEIGRLYNCHRTSALASVNHMVERVQAGDLRYASHVETLQQKLKSENQIRVMKISCPTCGAPIIAELQRQINELRHRLESTQDKRSE